MSLKIKAIAAVSTLILSAAASFGQDNQIQIAAHRGFWKCDAAVNSQNSIAALKQAQKNKFWGCELDVHLTSDNVVVVNHDASIEGVAIHTNTFEAISNFKLANGERRPTLDEYLKVAQKVNTTKIVLEIKIQDNVDKTLLLTDLCIQKLIDHNLYNPQRVMFISFSLEACKHLAVVAPEFTNQYLEGDIDPDTLNSYGINGIDYHYNVFEAHPEWVKRCHELGMSVNVWTVDKDEMIQKMIDLGVDCITTNVPLRVREMLGTREMTIVNR